MSELAKAHAAMQADPGDLSFWDLFARTEITLALAAEPEGETIVPQLFETSDGTFALGFIDAAGLSEFAGEAAAYAALPGRALAALLGPEGFGLALDPGGAAVLLTAAELSWLAETLATPPELRLEPIREVEAPGAVPDALLDAIAARLAPGLFEALVIVRVRGADAGEATPLIAVLGAGEGAVPPLAAALAEALTFSGAGPDWQLGFFPPDGALSQALLRHGQRLEITTTEPPARAAPGSIPGKPPRLR